METVIPWTKGKCFVWDWLHVIPFATSYVKLTKRELWFCIGTSRPKKTCLVYKYKIKRIYFGRARGVNCGCLVQRRYKNRFKALGKNLGWKLVIPNQNPTQYRESVYQYKEAMLHPFCLPFRLQRDLKLFFLVVLFSITNI